MKLNKNKIYRKLTKRIYRKLVELTPQFANFCSVIEKKNKSEEIFKQVTILAIELYNAAAKILPKLKKIVKKGEISDLKKAEFNELIYLFDLAKKINKKITKKFNRSPNTLAILRWYYDKRFSDLLMDRNSVFVFMVNYISRNFMNICLPSEFDVDKYKNEGQKVSLLTMLNETDWSKYFSDITISNELIGFSKQLFSTNWWNHAKYYRNVLVHRISLDTYYSDNYKNMNIRIHAYLPALCFIGLKYYFYNLCTELVNNDDKNAKKENKRKKHHKKLNEWFKYSENIDENNKTNELNSK